MRARVHLENRPIDWSAVQKAYNQLNPASMCINRGTTPGVFSVDTHTLEFQGVLHAIASRDAAHIIDALFPGCEFELLRPGTGG